MRILIVDEDIINSSKLKLVFSKYGDCETAPKASEALEMVVNSHEISNPFQLVAIEMDMKEMSGADTVQKIRKWETDNKKPKSKIILIVNAETHEDANNKLKGESISFLVKPYNRKKLENLLADIGMEKQEEQKKSTPPPKKTKIQSPKIDKKELEDLLGKITALITKPSPEQFKQMQGTSLLKELLQRGGDEAALLVGTYMSSDKVPLEIRQELITLAGLTRNTHLLIPLNKTINSEENIKVIQEAFLAVSKYDNQRALNILNQGLQKFKHPMLLNTIRTEISRIKQKNPILAILPRFLQTYKNPKNFRVTIDIIKKIVTPEDTDLFINYLKSGNQIIEDGAFEILCYTGELSLKTALFNFFEDRIQKISCLKENTCNELYNLLSYLFRYLLKNPFLIDEQISELNELFSSIKDLRAKQIIISFLCRSQRSEALEFIKSIYNKEKALQEHIIEELSGNQHAVDFLFEKYHQGQVLKEKVITSLLKTDQGLQYFVKHFFTFELDKQEIILKNITFNNQDFLMDFIKEIYDSKLYSLKFQLLKVLKENFLLTFKDVLFDEENQREFMFMGKEYLETIIQLFPISSMKMFYQKIAEEDLSNIKIKKYLGHVKSISSLEPVIYFNDTKLINQLFNLILHANNSELTSLFFSTFDSIKILDLMSYRYLLESANRFAEVKGPNLTEKEKHSISKLKAVLRDQLPDIRDIEQLIKQFNAIFVSKPVEREKLEKLIENNHMAVAVKIHHVVGYLASRINNPNIVKKDDRELFNIKFPFIAELIKKVSEQGEVKAAEDWTDMATRKELLKHFRERLRIIIAFKSKRATAFIRDQLLEFYPECEVLADTEFDISKNSLKRTDRLICDTFILKQLAEKKAITTDKIYLFLENRVDFAPFREFAPKVFMKPLSGHRVIRLIMQDLFLRW